MNKLIFLSTKFSHQPLDLNIVGMLTNGGPPAQRSLAWRSHFLPASKDQLFACKEVSFYIVNLEVDSERKKTMDVNDLPIITSEQA